MFVKELAISLEFIAYFCVPDMNHKKRKKKKKNENDCHSRGMRMSMIQHNKPQNVNSWKSLSQKKKKKEPVLLYNALPKLLLENDGSTKISGNSNNNNKTLPQTAR